MSTSEFARTHACLLTIGLAFAAPADAGPVISPGPNDPTRVASGLPLWGHAIELDGHDDEVRSLERFDLQKFTLEAWVLVTDAHSYGGGTIRQAGILAWGQPAFEGAAWDFYLYTGNTVPVGPGEMRVATRINYLRAGDSSLLADTPVGVAFWRHAAMTYDGASIRIYLDGQLDSEVETQIDVPPLGANAYLSIGSEFPGAEEFLGGRIDDVRIWDHARNGDEIRCAASHPLTGDEPGLFAYYTFDEANGQTVLDRSGNGRHAFLGVGTGPDSADPIRVESGVGDRPGFDGCACGVADLAEPLGLLDLDDITAFVGGFLAMDLAVDFNSDGLFDLDDISMFVASFLAGCP